MYHNTKSRISVNGTYSDYFVCSTGVRQGESLSPFLFAIYLNDLEAFLTNKNVIGTPTLSSELVKELGVYLNLFMLLYADDTVLISETKEIYKTN